MKTRSRSYHVRCATLLGAMSVAASVFNLATDSPILYPLSIIAVFVAVIGTTWHVIEACGGLWRKES